MALKIATSCYINIMRVNAYARHTYQFFLEVIADALFGIAIVFALLWEEDLAWAMDEIAEDCRDFLIDIEYAMFDPIANFAEAGLLGLGWEIYKD
jgi:hypothetical protein